MRVLSKVAFVRPIFMKYLYLYGFMLTSFHRNLFLKLGLQSYPLTLCRSWKSSRQLPMAGERRVRVLPPHTCLTSLFACICGNMCWTQRTTRYSGVFFLCYLGMLNCALPLSTFHVPYEFEYFRDWTFFNAEHALELPLPNVKFVYALEIMTCLLWNCTHHFLTGESL